MDNLTLEHMIKNCPVDNTFKIIGKKFTFHIIRNMAMRNQTRFNEFLGTIENINPKTLSLRLKELEETDLIERTVYDEIPIRIEYTLTKKGKDLQGIIDQMAAFSMKHYPKIVFKDGKKRNYKQVFKKPVTVLH
ncbi:transcriptional regulator [Candidatus Nitrosopumilus sp. SW]|uniref:winged helix-turn-helix transcriptional regulator n=1 Tax=Candidatus Nitrosopumilus sp. SW TaxID=2508726 RepID=UPI0011516D62|nr:helix-turn-helix domain-containing protein [Candidatus Nitrosopumilus sp. SW]QDI88557.1 transcriptional regulator [Candidatus Nitrosopumilus sp. SW]